MHIFGKARERRCVRQTQIRRAQLIAGRAGRIGNGFVRAATPRDLGWRREAHATQRNIDRLTRIHRTARPRADRL